MNTLTTLHIGYFFLTWVTSLILAVFWTPSNSVNTFLKVLFWVIVALGVFFMLQMGGFVVQVPL